MLGLSLLVVGVSRAVTSLAKCVGLCCVLTSFVSAQELRVSSSVVSYQYEEAIETATLFSPIASYQFFDRLPIRFSTLRTRDSSYYYQFTEAPRFILNSTSR